MLDGCIKNSLQKHDTKNQIIHVNQGCFKQKEGNIEKLYTIQNIFQYNKHVFCTFLNLQKAYDTVWRKALPQKLQKKCKVPNNTINWLSMKCKDAQSCTEVGNRLSTTFKTYNGLQQGKLSSPNLFNYYINDLIEDLNAQTNIGATINALTLNNLLFADDVMLIANTPRALQHY